MTEGLLASKEKDVIGVLKNLESKQLVPFILVAFYKELPKYYIQLQVIFLRMKPTMD